MRPAGDWQIVGRFPATSPRDNGGRGRASTWQHSSGAIVRRVGHPTALYPYFVPGRFDELGAFRLLVEAQQAALQPPGAAQ